MVKLGGPLAVGMPLIRPVALNQRQPAVKRLCLPTQVYGPVPPLTETVCE